MFNTNLFRRMSTQISKTRVILGWILAGLLTGLFLFSAVGKLTTPEQMEQLKLGNWRIIIALGEIVSSLLFLLPKTNKYGSLLLSSYMGGAIIIHMTSGTSIVMPVMVLLLVWLVAFVRNPELYKKM